MNAEKSLQPLAERMRPVVIEDFIGQSHLMGQGKIIRQMLERDSVFSMILWGDPGTGKTTLAKLIADHCSMEAHFLSAISSGVADVRKVVVSGVANRAEGKRTLLFLDEIHRFNKAQQDSILSAVESGDVVLIGATTENPSFQVIAPLLSRTRVLKLNTLNEDELAQILERALSQDGIMKEMDLSFGEGVREGLLGLAGGDARRLLNILETASVIAEDGAITADILQEAYDRSSVYYDRAGDRHYDTISAFIKSMRGSDPNAAVYYLARMIIAGEDPEFIARRMVIFASEDIGNAAPQALPFAVSVLTAVKNIGMPEVEIVLSHCATFLASAPKSNASYLAIKRAKNAAADSSFTVPMHIRNAPTGLMKSMGYAKGYRYPHDFPQHFVREQYLPRGLEEAVYYDPSVEGTEKAVRARLATLWPEKYPPEKK